MLAASLWLFGKMWDCPTEAARRDPVRSKKICSPATGTHENHRRDWPQADLNAGTSEGKALWRPAPKSPQVCKAPKTRNAGHWVGMRCQGEVSLHTCDGDKAPSDMWSLLRGEAGALGGWFYLAWVKFNFKMHKVSVTAKKSLPKESKNKWKKVSQCLFLFSLPSLISHKLFSAIYAVATHNLNLLVHSLTELEYLFHKLN